MKPLTCLIVLFLLISCKKDALQSDLELSREVWLAFKKSANNNYSYTVKSESWPGFGDSTIISISNGNVSGRKYSSYINVSSILLYFSILLYLLIGFICFSAVLLRFLSFWKPGVVLFLSEVPLSAHTPPALITGRYPLQSGLRMSDNTIKTCPIPQLYRTEVILWMGKRAENGPGLLDRDRDQPEYPPTGSAHAEYGCGL